jgi:hypothetical protein
VISILMKRRKKETKHSPSLSIKKRSYEHTAIWQLSTSKEESLSQKTNLPALWFWTSHPTECWEINVCRLSHPVYVSLFIITQDTGKGGASSEVTIYSSSIKIPETTHLRQSMLPLKLGKWKSEVHSE